MIHKKTIQLTKSELKALWIERKFDIVINQICDDGQLETAFKNELNSDMGEIIEIEVIIRSKTNYSPIGSNGIQGEESTK